MAMFKVYKALYVWTLLSTLQILCRGRKLPDLIECHNRVADVVFVLDSSFSLRETDFESQILFVRQFVEEFAIGSDDVRVGVITFGSDVRPDFHLGDHGSKKELKAAISGIKQLMGSQGTDTGKALEYVRTEMFKEENGGRSAATQIIILITDGLSQNMTKTLMEASWARSLGMKIFAIGVGSGPDEKELRGIASPPSDAHMFRVDSFEALPVIEKALKNVVCERPSNDQRVTKPSPTMPSRQNCGGKPADVYFIVDSSSSIWGPDFTRQLDFMKEVISFFDLGPDKTRVGVITFSDGIHPVIPLTGSHSHRELENRIDKIPQNYGETNTDRALRYVTDYGFSKEIARPEVAHVAIVITDGQSRHMSKTIREAQKAHKKGITLFAIGIGYNVDLHELRDIASDPNEHYVFKVEDFVALSGIRDALAIKTCQVPSGMLKDQPAFKKTETDVMFLFDPESAGRHHTRTIEHLISELVRDMDSACYRTRAGILRDTSSPGSDIRLSQYNNAYSFKRQMQNVDHKGFQPLIHRMRRHSFQSRYGGRPRAQKVAVLFVDNKLDNPGQTILETRRAKFLNIRVMVVAVGDSYQDKQIDAMVSSPVPRNVVRADSYKTLIDVKENLMTAICAGPESRKESINRS